MKIRRSGASVLLLEVLFAILFFSLASAVCIQLFVKAASLSAHTVAANRGVALAESIEEEFSVSVLDSRDDYYDKNYVKLSSSDGASFLVRTEVTSDADPVCTVTVIRLSDEETIVSLTSVRHERRTAA